MIHRWLCWEATGQGIPRPPMRQWRIRPLPGFPAQRDSSCRIIGHRRNASETPVLRASGHTAMPFNSPSSLSDIKMRVSMPRTSFVDEPILKNQIHSKLRLHPLNSEKNQKCLHGVSSWRSPRQDLRGEHCDSGVCRLCCLTADAIVLPTRRADAQPLALSVQGACYRSARLLFVRPPEQAYYNRSNTFFRKAKSLVVSLMHSFTGRRYSVWSV